MRHVCRLLGILGAGVLLAGCLEGSQVSETGTTVNVDTSQSVDPGTIVCNPFDDGQNEGLQQNGLTAELFYLDSTLPHYDHVADYINNGLKVPDITLFFNQLYIPTRPFDRGFTTQANQMIKTPQGDTLYEWFALRFKSRLQLAPQEAPGAYQLAILSDDGAVLSLDDGTGQMRPIVDGDGTHPTRMSCATEALDMAQGEKIPLDLKYYQGPRYHISLVVMWRPWPTDPKKVRDPLCDREGNDTFFDSTQNPPAPKANFNALLSRGWKVLTPENYALPEVQPKNPCSGPAAEIGELDASRISMNSALITWSTTLDTTSQILYREESSSAWISTGVDPNYLMNHEMRLMGLKPNTNYVVKVRAATREGGLSESIELRFKTRLTGDVVAL